MTITNIWLLLLPNSKSKLLIFFLNNSNSQMISFEFLWVLGLGLVFGLLGFLGFGLGLGLGLGFGLGFGLGLVF